MSAISDLFVKGAFNTDVSFMRLAVNCLPVFGPVLAITNAYGIIKLEAKLESVRKLHGQDEKQALQATKIIVNGVILNAKLSLFGSMLTIASVIFTIALAIFTAWFILPIALSIISSMVSCVVIKITSAALKMAEPHSRNG